MRKVVLLFILFVFSLSRADAQEFHFIPRIGLNLANTYPESFADMRPGLNIGVAEEIRFSKLFALEPGVYYSMQGYQKENAKGETADKEQDQVQGTRMCFQKIHVSMLSSFEMTGWKVRRGILPQSGARHRIRVLSGAWKACCRKAVWRGLLWKPVPESYP